MSCELYNSLTDNSLLAGTGPFCRYEKECMQTSSRCKWGPLLRQVARNMKVEDTSEDLEHDALVAELEAKAKFDTAVRKIKIDSFTKSLISISRVN